MAGVGNKLLLYFVFFATCIWHDNPSSLPMQIKHLFLEKCIQQGNFSLKAPSCHKKTGGLSRLYKYFTKKRC